MKLKVFGFFFFLELVVFILLILAQITKIYSISLIFLGVFLFFLIFQLLFILKGFIEGLGNTSTKMNISTKTSKNETIPPKRIYDRLDIGLYYEEEQEKRYYYSKNKLFKAYLKRTNTSEVRVFKRNDLFLTIVLENSKANINSFVDIFFTSDEKFLLVYMHGSNRIVIWNLHTKEEYWNLKQFNVKGAAVRGKLLELVQLNEKDQTHKRIIFDIEKKVLLSSEEMDADNKRIEAESMIEKGIEQEQLGDFVNAEKFYLSAVRSDNSWSVPYFNLGLLYKRWKKWAKSLTYNEMALEHNPEDEGAWWNLGIAATALKSWPKARRAWKRFGIDIPKGTGPILLELGMVPIRLNAENENTEVVWCERIDPARAVIFHNIPLPNSGYRWKDIILHDGAPVDMRKIDGQDVPVFDALELFEKSNFKTYEINVFTPREEDMKRLLELSEEYENLMIEDWTDNVNLVYKKGEKDNSRTTSWNQERSFGIASESREEVENLINRWITESEDRILLSEI